MKASKAYVQCPHCGGTGTVELTGIYADTLRLLIRRPGLNGAALAKIAGCKATAMNNRLKALEGHGVAEGEQYGRQIIWKHKTLTWSEQDCPACQGTGEVDSGGSDPSGRWINVACPDCDGTGKPIEPPSESLDWAWDGDSDSLMAPSVFHADGVTLPYAIKRRAGDWEAVFEGKPLATGSLAHCMVVCESSEQQAARDYSDQMHRGSMIAPSGF